MTEPRDILEQIDGAVKLLLERGEPTLLGQPFRALRDAAEEIRRLRDDKRGLELKIKRLETRKRS